MKAISIRQPWASLIISGEKTVECRSWKTSYRGHLAVCASQKPFLLDNGIALPGGVILGVVELVDIMKMTRKDLGPACIRGKEAAENVLNGYAWHIRKVFECVPVPIKGRLHLFDIDVSLVPRPEEFKDHLSYLEHLQNQSHA